MNRLWGMIKSLQVTLMLPLCQVWMPANVQMLYFFMNYNLNLQLFSLSFLDFTFLTYLSQSYPEERAFSDHFWNQDIF